jgi:hypothetical protein
VFLAIFLPPSFVTIHTANGFLCIKFPFRKLGRKEGDEEKLKVLRRKIFFAFFIYLNLVKKHFIAMVFSPLFMDLLGTIRIFVELCAEKYFC